MSDTLSSNARPMAPLGWRLANSDFLEAARIEHGHGERIAHDERGGGACGGGHVERAGFLGHLDVEHDFRVLAKCGARRGCHGDDLHGEPPDGR